MREGKGKSVERCITVRNHAFHVEAILNGIGRVRNGRKPGNTRLEFNTYHSCLCWQYNIKMIGCFYWTADVSLILWRLPGLRFELFRVISRTPRAHRRDGAHHG